LLRDNFQPKKVSPRRELIEIFKHPFDEEKVLMLRHIQVKVWTSLERSQLLTSNDLTQRSRPRESS